MHIKQTCQDLMNCVERRPHRFPAIQTVEEFFGKSADISTAAQLGLAFSNARYKVILCTPVQN
jgi:hypothetical protein